MATKHRKNVKMPQTTLRASSRKRAALAGQADKVRKHKKQDRHLIDPDSPDEPYGVLLSEHRRMGEAVPHVPDVTVRSTRRKR